MELRDYLHLLWVHWPRLIAGLLLGGLIAWGWSQEQPPVYTATGSGLVSVVSSTDMGTGLAAQQLAKDKVASYVEIGSWCAVADHVIESLGLDATPEALVSRVSVTNPSGTVIFRVSATSDTPEEARDLAEAWIRGMIAVVAETEPEDTSVMVTPGDSARLPTRPSSPNVTRNTALGALVGLVVSVGYVALRTVLDRRIRSKDTVEQASGLPVIGTIPLVPSLSKRATLLPLVSGPHAAKDQRLLAEAIRELRANLRYMKVDDPPKAIVITSALPRDGKTTTAAHLAVALAQTGQPVVLIDADLRRPHLSKLFELPNHTGLTEILVDELDAAVVGQIVDTLGPLTVIAAGTTPPNPSELLESRRMAHLIRHLSRDAYVLLDAPPLTPVSDAAVLAAHSDGALIVVATRKTTSDALRRSLESLSLVNATALGIVMNRVPTHGPGKTTYGYEYRGNYTANENDSRSQAASPPEPQNTDTLRSR